jgi:hypothetical protein
MSSRQTLDRKTDHANVLYYGAPGCGKTTGSASLAHIGKTLVIDTESGLRRQPLKALEVPVDRIEVHTDLRFSSLMDLLREVQADLARDPSAWAGLAFDSVSEFQRGLLEQDARGRFRLTQGDYGENAQKMRALLRQFRDLPCHVAFTAHVRRDEDDDGEVRLGPSLTPAVSNDLLGFVDIVCFAQTHPLPGTDEPVYVGSFRPGRKFVAKDRFGVLPPRLASPTFERILNYTSGRFTRDALRDAQHGELSDHLDPVQNEYIKQLTAAKAAGVMKGE